SNHRNDANRSLPALATLALLWNVPGITFVSLQKGAGEDEARSTELPIVHLGSDICDFADTASIIDQLDLVICVDTAVAHVAGALGKPCWVLLPAIGCDWRWMRDRSDSPWYPGALRLFRQKQRGDWSDTIAEVETALREFVR
ncbi:glycosyltransferase family 9 protein, partial [Paraburkholderia fungorum]|uniref:glycosyltransferase family 9 protein n=1 Tax=Paraburkholderia fungorum TaxID=134537 RepID=UPI0038BAF421